MSQTYHVRILHEAITPIAHMRGNEGNVSVINRQEVMTPAGLVKMPVLSGNALRHRMIREPLAEHLVEAWGLSGRVTWECLNFLYHGGNLTGSTGREDTQRIAKLCRLIPFVRLLGGTLPDQILCGSVSVSDGLLVCREFAPAIRALFPASSGWEVPDGLRCGEDYLGQYQHTRGDAAKTHPLRGPKEQGVDSDTNLMIFSGETVVRGALFAQRISLRSVSDLELGAMLFALRQWQASGGTVGGQSSRGKGYLQSAWHVEQAYADHPAPVDEDAPVAAYLNHVAAFKDEGVAFLLSIYGEPGAKPAKPVKENKRKAKSAKEVTLEEQVATEGPDKSGEDT